MRVDIDQLSNDSHVWIFGVSPALAPAQGEALLRTVDAFLDDWAAHGIPIRGARDLQEGSFLIVAADENREKSGCSIDRMFGALRQLERELNVKILDSDRIFYRDGAAVQTTTRAGFRTAANAETPVFDVLVERLGDIRSGSWVRPAAESWHRQLLLG